MNTILKNSFKLGVVALLLLFTSTIIYKSANISKVSTQRITADKPAFGADEYKYEPVKVETEEDILASRIKWSILIFSILLVLVLANAFDISALTTRITGRESINGNNVNKWIMLLFMIVGLVCVAWEYQVHGKLILLGNASSAHGETYDSMFRITLILTTIVFVATQILLFWFPFKYAHKEGRKALYFAHNNRLELFWTIIPAIVLTILVLRGHQTWRSIVYAEEYTKEKITKIEIFAEQFAWTARYAGADNVLGEVDYKFISGTNKLGLAYRPQVDSLLVELVGKIKQDQAALLNLPQTLEGLKNDLKAATDLQDSKAIESTEKQIEMICNGDTKEELEASINRKTKQIERIKTIISSQKIYASTFTNAAEDDVISQEVHLAKGKTVTFLFRSRDIIHSAWLPHFRVQMNVVPGMPTKFTFIPTKTTAEAKNENGKDFEYYLFCNKICGTSHYNMKMKVVIEENQEAVDAWLAKQKPAFKELPKPIAVPVSTIDTTNNTVDTIKKMTQNKVLSKRIAIK